MYSIYSEEELTAMVRTLISENKMSPSQAIESVILFTVELGRAMSDA